MRIKTWIIVLINALLCIVVFSISMLYYYEFTQALDQKVLSQLSSIERLKRIQIEKHLQTAYNSFVQSNRDYNDVPIQELQKLSFKIHQSGAYDLTPISKDGTLLIGFVKVKNSKPISIKTLQGNTIQEILLERTGMGNSGETYLVGADYKLRTQSRFFPKTPPFLITSNTLSVQNVLHQSFKKGIYKDYRNIRVYSASHLIKFSHIQWAILSEMDVTEVRLPLVKMKRNLIFIALSVFILALLIGVYFANYLAKPLVIMESQLLAMTQGKFNKRRKVKTNFKEINDILNALDLLQDALTKAIQFSKNIGNMKLHANYQPNSEYDILGKSLVKMKDKLIEYQHQLNLTNTNKKRMLIKGQEAERKRLSQELHDGIGPLLTSLRLFIENTEIDISKKKEIKQLIDHTIQEIRSMSYALMPSTLIDFGLSETLKTYIKTIQNTNHIDIDFNDSMLIKNSKINSDTSISIFRICQELINNSIKHANASIIRLSITEFENLISIFYFDNGIGYHPKKIVLGLGIISIKERVEILNGTIEFNPKANNSSVEIEIPLNNEAQN